MIAPLAYMTAKTHGLHEKAQEILAAAGKTEEEIQVPTETAELPKLPQTVNRLEDPNWPRLTLSKSFFEGAFVASEGQIGQAAAPAFSYDDQIDNIEEAAGDWGEGDDDDLGIPGLSSKARAEDDLFGTPEPNAEDDEEGGGWDLDDDIKADIDAEISQAAAQETAEFVPPTAGTSESSVWAQNSPLAADHIAAGAFESAMQVKRREPKKKCMGSLSESNSLSAF